MPQASDELRAEWDGPGGQKAARYLHDAGYRIDAEWRWVHRAVGHEPTEREISAVRYLIDEWDYEGIVG